MWRPRFARIGGVASPAPVIACPALRQQTGDLPDATEIGVS
jgi:hypothetical protein